MFPLFPPGERRYSDAEIDRLLHEPAPPYQPLPQLSETARVQPPEVGGLAWLLAHRLAPERLCGLQVSMLTSAGPVAGDPGLAQAWQQARHHHRAAPADDFAPPPAEAPDPAGRETPPAAGLGLRERALTFMNQLLCSDFALRIGLGGEPPSSRDTDGLEDYRRRVHACAHVLGVPVGRHFRNFAGPPRGRPQDRTAEQAFGMPLARVEQALRDAAQRQRDSLQRFGGPAIPPEELAQWDFAFGQHVDGCVFRLQRMGRVIDDGSDEE